MPRRKVKRVVKQKQKQRQSVVVNINQQRKTVRQPRSKVQAQPVFNPIFQFSQPQYDASSIINAIKALDRQSEIVRDVARVDVGERLLAPRAPQAERASPSFFATVAQERIARERAKGNFKDLPPTIPEPSESYPRAEEPEPTRSVKDIVKEYNKRFH